MKTTTILTLFVLLCGTANFSYSQSCSVPPTKAITVVGNQYAFQWRASNVTPLTNIGLAFNTVDNEYQFRRVDAARSILAISPTAAAYVRAGDPCFGNYAQFSADGSLRFFGTADYEVDNNKYAFRSRSDEDNGLFFNVTDNQYEFRSNSAAASFTIKANTAGGVTSGSFASSGDGQIDGSLTVDGNVEFADGVIEVDGASKRVGINNTFMPLASLDVYSTDSVFTSAIRGISYNSAMTGTGVWAEADRQGLFALAGGFQSTTSWGIYSTAYGIGGSSGERFGIFAEAYDGTANYAVFGSTAVSSSGTNYAVYADGDMAYTGSLLDLSDVRFKENIEDIENASALVRQLKPRIYNLKTEEYAYLNFQREQEFGFVAQELEHVLPLLVSDMVHPGPKDAEGNYGQEIKFKGVNYVGMIPVIVAAMQEQESEVASNSAVNMKLLNMVDELAEKVLKLEKDLASCCISHHENETGSDNSNNDAKLGQNIPNPFNGTTLISYYLPENSGSAVIRVVDLTGKIVEEFQLSDTGFGQVEFSIADLSSGMFVYALHIDGELIDSRQMQLLK